MRNTLPPQQRNILRMPADPLKLTARLARNVAARRAYLGVPQTVLEEAHRIPRSTLRYLEAPEKRPTISTKGPTLEVIGKLADALQVEAWQLLVDDFNAEQPPALAAPQATDEKQVSSKVVRGIASRPEVPRWLCDLLPPDRWNALSPKAQQCIEVYVRAVSDMDSPDSGGELASRTQFAS